MGCGEKGKQDNPDSSHKPLTGHFTGTHILRSSPYAFGAHVAIVEVSGDTGAIRILKYAAVHDAGRIVNPMLAEGQVQGAITQGIGQALLEGMVYTEDGQPLIGGLFQDEDMRRLCVESAAGKLA